MSHLKTCATAASFFFLLFVALVFPFQDADLFFYLGLGRLIFETGSLPVQDPYLFQFKDWHIQHEWLSYIVFYFSYWLGSWWGILSLKIALWGGAFAALISSARQWKIPQGFSFPLLLLVGLACSHRFVERASLFSDVGLMLLTAGLLSRRLWQSRHFVWILPLSFALWVNLHPGFVLGLVLLTAAVVLQGRQATRQQWGTVLLSYLAVLVNPLFVEGALYPLQTAFKDEWALHRKLNFEWMPTFSEPFLSTWEVKALILVLIVTGWLMVLTLLRKRKGHWFAVFAFAVFVYLAQNASRFMTTSALGFAVVAFYFWHQLNWSFSEKWESRLRVFCAIVFLSMGVWILNNGYNSASGKREFAVGIEASPFPVGAVQFLQKNNLQGRIFNEYEWGSFFIWELNRPESLFIHGHVDDPRILAYEYHGMNTSREFFEDSVRRHDFRFFILDVTKLHPDLPIVQHLKSWKVIYQDQRAVIWAR